MTTTTQPIELEDVRAATATDKRRVQKKELWRNRGLLLPAVVFLILLTQIPFLTTIGFSLTKWNLLYPNDRAFAGFDNYTSALTSGDLWPSIRATVLITAFSVTLAVLFGLLFAVLLDRQFRGRALARTLMITPFLIMPAAASLIWKYSMFDTNIGMINWVFRSLHLPVVAWSTEHPMATVVIVLTWQFTPFMMLILLAGLQSRPLDVIEAAGIDGANQWEIFRYMTLPHLRQYLELSALLGSIYIVQNFDAVFVITSGGLGTANLPYTIYQTFYTAHDYGRASAAGVIVVIGTILIATFALRSVSTLFREESGR